MRKIQLLLMLCYCFAFVSCDQSTSHSEEMKESLFQVVNKMHPGSKFYTKTISDDNSTQVILKHLAYSNYVELDQRDTTVLLGYYAEKNIVKDAAIYKSELIKRKNQIIALTTDLSGKVIKQINFPIQDVDPGNQNSEGFDTFEACIDSFFCTFEAIQCKANETCLTQFYGTTCCLTDGSCYSIHFHFPPNHPKCKFVLPKLDIPLVVTRY